MVRLVILYMMVSYILLLLKILYDAAGKTNRIVLYWSSCVVYQGKLYMIVLCLFLLLMVFGGAKG